MNLFYNNEAVGDVAFLQIEVTEGWYDRFHLFEIFLKY